jgi:hypothetical protein
MPCIMYATTKYTRVYLCYISPMTDKEVWFNDFLRFSHIPITICEKFTGSPRSRDPTIFEVWKTDSRKTTFVLYNKYLGEFQIKYYRIIRFSSFQRCPLFIWIFFFILKNRNVLQPWVENYQVLKKNSL